MPMINGMWVDDATGVPDPGMPMGVGDPTGANMPPPPPPPPPQMARPTPGATPGFQVPQQLLQPNFTPPQISEPLTGQQVSGEWNKLVKPEMSGGDIASAILQSPMTVPMGIIEELRGLMGGDTIAGWGAQAEARYSNPATNESRAFGVPVAQPLGAGDRFLGVVTGRAQDKAAAGIALRNEINRYNKQRTSELGQFKDVMDIYKGSAGLQKDVADLKFQPEQQQFERNRDVRAGERLQLDRRSSGATATLAEMRAKKMREDATRAAALREILKGNPQLAGDPVALMQAAGGDPDLVNKVITAAKGITEIPDPTTGLPLGAQTQFDAAEAARKDKAARALETEARAAATATEEARVRAPQRNAAVDVLRAQRDPVGPNWDMLQEILGQVTGGKLGVPTQAQDFYDYDAETRRLKAEAYRSRGLPVPADLASPTSTPVPGATPSDLVDRIGTMSPADKTVEQLQREAEAAVAPAVPSLRPTPMATPRPQGTTAMVDLNKAPPEADRQADATKEARLKELFLRNWVEHEGWNSPRSGARWNSKWSAFMAANGL